MTTGRTMEPAVVVTPPNGGPFRGFSLDVNQREEKRSPLASPQKDAFWREQGAALRKRLIQEDEQAGGLTFLIRQEVDIAEYFNLADRILHNFLTKWIVNQYLMSGRDEWTKLLDSYTQGNRLVKFITKVLPLHKDYYSPLVLEMRHKSQEQLSVLLEYLEEVALTIDQEEFRKHALRDFQDDRGPGLSMYFDSVETSDDDFAAPSVAPDKGLLGPMAMSDSEQHDDGYQDPPLTPLVDDEKNVPTIIPRSDDEAKETIEAPRAKVTPPASEDVNSFFSSSVSHISLLENDAPTFVSRDESHISLLEEDEPKTVRRKKRASPPSSKKVSFGACFRGSPELEDRSWNSRCKTPSPNSNSMVPNVNLPYFITREEPVEHTPKTVKEFSSWMSGDETVATVLSSDMSSSTTSHSRTAASSSSVYYYQLDTANHKTWDDTSSVGSLCSKDDVGLTNPVNKRGARRRAEGRFKGCLRCVIE